MGRPAPGRSRRRVAGTVPTRVGRIRARGGPGLSDGLDALPALSAALEPAAPGRELARALFDWFRDGSTADLDAMRTYASCMWRASGPGRITELADFSMLLASRLNFLPVQAGIAIDPRAERRHCEWAEHEIDEALRTLPNPRQPTYWN